jgi:hypothetical protein
MSEKVGIHHSFDIYLAAELKSTELAILVHHFQHWINLNARCKRNFYEDRTWMYQTLNDIAAHFPYLSVKQVERLINRLVELNILQKGNFNKSAYDRTVWYSFVNEIKFSISRNREMEIPESGNQNPEIGRPIPDTKPDTKPDITSLKVSPEVDATKVAEKKFSKDFDNEIKELAVSVLDLITQAKPTYAVPKDLTPLWTHLDFMIRLDKRTPQKILDVLRWALSDDFWRANMFKPNVAKYLREKFDQLEEKMITKPKQKDRKFAPSSNDEKAVQSIKSMRERAL